jgi:dephospho-CoA kinase
MIVIGLTGSIGMGKTTTAAMLEKLGIPVHDADAAVHALLKPSGKGAKALTREFPFSKYPEIYGRKNKKGIRPVNRQNLGRLAFSNTKVRKKLEKILHPLVRKAQQDFIKKHKKNGLEIVALDIPLLFETEGEKRVDYTIVVTAPLKVQKARVLARPGMDAKKFNAILKSQMPDKEKRARADFILQTGLGRAHAMKELRRIVKTIKSKGA